MIVSVFKILVFLKFFFLSDITIFSCHVFALSVLFYVSQDDSFKTLGSVNLQSQATAYARLVESEAIRTASVKSNAESGLFTILPIQAQ